MTETEWLECDKPRVLVYSGVESERKWRLVVCACCRNVWNRIEDRRTWNAIEASERLADGLLLVRNLGPIIEAAEQAWNEIHQKHVGGRERQDGAKLMVASAVSYLYHSPDLLPSSNVRIALEEIASSYSQRRAKVERLAQVGIIRDIFGNPFRPVAFDAEWRTDTVLSLARHMYESRDFSAMPILADSLQDAGCENDDILNHCRGDGPHVRGCWVVDLVLGKE